jgi:ATP-dependent helicase HrpA
LSIQDPRERPLDQKEAAAAAHKRFSDPQSDFLALLNIWNEVHDQWEKLRTQNQRRKFCRQHFLSYLRMREWQDVYTQLHDALADLRSFKLNESNATYDAIHRSILAGLIGHVAQHDERNSYQAAGNRLVSVFPGSALYARGEPPGKPASRGGMPLPKPKSHQPRWIVAGEIVETSQLFARTLAGIDPQWIFQLAPHCCKVTHQNPHWSAGAGNVLVEEIITLHGLEVQRRKVAYGNLNAKDATAIFIRSALVEENLARSRRGAEAEDDKDEVRILQPVAGNKPELPPQYRFLAHNRAVREKIENWRTRVRRYDLGDLDQALCDFYTKHIENVSSLHELNRLLGDRSSQDFLCASEAELAGGQSLNFDPEAFPDAVPVSGQPVSLAYSYAPGEEHDGVTVKLPFTLAQTASSALIEWAVPGLREEIISELLRALPKAIRRELMPFPPKVGEIVRDFQPAGPSFLQDLAGFLHRRFGVAVPVAAWPADSLPAHLRPRIEIVDDAAKSLGSGRDLNQLRRRLEQAKVEPKPEAASGAWSVAAQQWERFGITDWNFGDLPERITISDGPGLPQYAWSGLEFEDGIVNVRLFRSNDAAKAASLKGVQRLVELAIQKDLGWLEKDLRTLNRFDALYAPLGTGEELRETALNHVKRHLLPAEPLRSLTKPDFQAAVDEARRRLPGMARQLHDGLGTILKLRQQVQQQIGVPAAATPRSRTFSDLGQLGKPPASIHAGLLAGELTALVPSRFLERIAHDRLAHLPRYLKALAIRGERAVLNPVKHQERMQQLAPYQEALKKLEAQPLRSVAARRELELFGWWIEEFKVSLFAQELGTAFPVSAKRLDQQLERVRQAQA